MPLLSWVVTSLIVSLAVIALAVAFLNFGTLAFNSDFANRLRRMFHRG